MQTAMIRENPQSSDSQSTKLLRRLGVAGFAFFFIKGMLWLLIPAAMYLIRG